MKPFVCLFMRAHLIVLFLFRDEEWNAPDNEDDPSWLEDETDIRSTSGYGELGGLGGLGLGGGVWVGSSSRGSLDGGARRHRPICFHFRRMNDSDSSWLRLTARPATTRTVDPPPPSSHPTLPPAGRSFDFFFVFVTAFYPVSTIGYFC